MSNFASDNVTAVCPEVLEAIVAANAGSALPYGADDCTTGLAARFSAVFEREVAVFPVVTGTAANALALSAVTPPYGAVYCHALSHINTDECGAPELFTGGAKLVPLPGEGARIPVERLAAAITGRGNVHHAQPASLSLTQASEAGTVYRLDELAALTELAHAQGLTVHMDGARFANALVGLGCSPAETTWQAGIDLMSFGATKNGCLAAEAIVFFKPELAEGFGYLHKRAGQLLSKMRFVSAQLEAYLSDGLWLRNASHANAMAARLSAGMAALPGIELAHPVEANEVFVRLPPPVAEGLRAAGFNFHQDELDGSAARLVAAWNTTAEDVDALLATAARLAAPGAA
jgi:threonine aldolase